MTHLSDWEKYIERRSKNIGFATKLGAFRDPTPAEKAAALAYEIKTWQDSIGKKNYTVSVEYSVSRGVLPNVPEPQIDKAIRAYIETPMEAVGRYIGLDVKIYERNWFQRIMDNFFSLFKREKKIGQSWAEKSPELISELRVKERK